MCAVRGHRVPDYAAMSDADLAAQRAALDARRAAR